MVNYILSLPTIPHVLSTSYAFNEPGLDPDSASNLCNAYMQLAARGTSIVRHSDLRYFRNVIANDMYVAFRLG